jgi:site-specific DNA-methyltransferase (adenine-specific)
VIDLRINRGDLPGCLADVEDNTYHAVLCDPPYGLGEIRDPAALLRSWLDGEDGEQGVGMLARTWDVVVPPSAWREYLRVTRPGGLCFAFAHSKKYHWQAMSMELAGWKVLPFVIRIHGSDMAKGHNVSKAIDKAEGAERKVVGSKLGNPGYARDGRNQAFSGTNAYDDGRKEGSFMCSSDITAPATPLAALFDGHNTALKNQTEPIVCAVKPPDGTWAENAARWGCGAFNVQAGRLPSGPDHAAKCASVVGCDSPEPVATGTGRGPRADSYDPAGRYPSNLLLEHDPDCGADWCVPGCGVRELGEMGREKGVHSAGGRRARDGVRRNASAAYGETRGAKVSARIGDVSEGADCTRFFYQARASARERAVGCEDLLWRRAPEHPDGWELVDRETWERIGDEAAEAAKLTEGYRERMAEGYIRRNGKPIQSRGAWSASLERSGLPPQEGAGVLDTDRLDAAAYLEAARARVRTTGNPHLALKALDGTAYLARLLLQPVVDGHEPRLLVPYAGTGSESIGAMLAGWERIDTWETSGQWCEVHRARAEFWHGIVQAGGVGSAVEMLRLWGTASGEDPEAEQVADQLSVFDLEGVMA